MNRVMAAGLAVMLAGCASPSAVGESAAGVYDGGQAEIAATLELRHDGRYAYSLSYGAVDEASEGAWRAIDGGLMLKSDPSIAPAFERAGARSGDASALLVELDLPQGMPRKAFSALVTLADGSSFAAEFGSDRLEVPLVEGERVERIMLALPLYDLRSEVFTVEPGQDVLSFRFVPNDLGFLVLDDAFLPARNGAYLLERYNRLLKFRRVDP